MTGVSSDLLSVLIVGADGAHREEAVEALQAGCRDAALRWQVAASAPSSVLTECLDAGGEPPDAILLVSTGVATGVQALRAIRRACKFAPVVVATEVGDLDATVALVREGAADCVNRNALRPARLVRAIRFAIERKLYETELIKLARTDPLTGLINRRAFFEQLRSALVQARRSRLACAVIAFDVDNFKEINNVFGHKVGDDVLVEVGRRLTAALRESDFVARIGGDEFAILATNLNGPADAMEIAGKVVSTVAAIDEVDEMRLDLSVSVGISVFPMDQSDADALVSHADLAMYRSKAGKTGAITFFDADMDEVVKARHQLKHSMPQDIVRGRFFLVFQPIVDAVSRRIVAAEGLARWRDAGDKVIAPGEFIPIAEESGTIGTLGNRLLEDACAQIARWSAHSNLVPVSLNVSPIQCRDPGFAARLIATVERLGISPRLINIEITESAMLRNLDVTQRNLEMIRAFGIGIHIDDFGTGYSSLSLLRDLPIDVLKIDRTFVRDLDERETRAIRVVQAIVDLSQKLGFRTIAEGVESETQAIQLRDIGVDALQGFYFSRPMSGDVFDSWLVDSESCRVA
jgi:diguanylate cyclase